MSVISTESILYFDKLKQQCENIKKDLTYQNIAYDVIIQKTDNLVNESQLQGEAYDNYKYHMSYYKEVLEAIKEANNFDIYDCNKTILVLEEKQCNFENVLDGEFIINKIKEAQKRADLCCTMKDHYKALCWKSSKNLDESSEYYHNQYERYCGEEGYALLEKRRYEEKLARFQEIEDRLCGLFENGNTLRNYAYQGILGLYNEYDELGGYTTPNMDWVKEYNKAKEIINNNVPPYYIFWSYSVSEGKDIQNFEKNYLDEYNLKMDGNTEEWSEEAWERFEKENNFAKAARTRKRELMELGIPEDKIFIIRVDNEADFVEKWNNSIKTDSIIGGIETFSHGNGGKPEWANGGGQSSTWTTEGKINTPKWNNNGAIAPYIYLHGCHTYQEPLEGSKVESNLKQTSDRFGVKVTGYSSLSKFSSNEKIYIPVKDFSKNENDVYLEPLYLFDKIPMPFTIDSHKVEIKP